MEYLLPFALDIYLSVKYYILIWFTSIRNTHASRNEDDQRTFFFLYVVNKNIIVLSISASTHKN